MNSPEQKLYGEWTGFYGREALAMTFLSDGTVLVREGNSIESGTYTVDMDEEPAHLDIGMETGEEIKTIMEFVDDDHIRLVDNESRTRPTSFGRNGRNNPVVLTKEEDFP